MRKVISINISEKNPNTIKLKRPIKKFNPKMKAPVTQISTIRFIMQIRVKRISKEAVQVIGNVENMTVKVILIMIREK